jgi:hypothetical protein
MLSIFGFGKRRRRSTKSRKSTKKGARKPPAALLRMCKKYKVKTTVKRGTKRVYKKARLLKKLCMRKKKMMLKKKKTSKRTKSRKVRRTRRVRRSRFGGTLEEVHKKNGGAKLLFGAGGCSAKYNNSMMFGGLLNEANARQKLPPPAVEVMFGRRKSSKKLSKPAAMKAFKQFYRRHCRSSRMGGRFRFGSGGNPPLSGGYEFCPSGQGGVLGANSTGLFPSPCTPMDAAQAAAEANVALPTYASPSAVAFGRRYGGRRKCYGKGKSRYCLRLKPKRKDLYFVHEKNLRRRRV